MKRDMVLVREILEEAESWAVGTESVLHLPDRDNGLVQAHVGLMGEAGFLKVLTIHSLEATFRTVQEITWAGYDLLDELRCEEI